MPHVPSVAGLTADERQLLASRFISLNAYGYAFIDPARLTVSVGDSADDADSLYLELAFAEARLKSVDCPTGRPESTRVGVKARPGIANLYLAEVDRSKLAGFDNPLVRAPAKLVQMSLVSVTGQAHAEVANMNYKTLTFSWTDIRSGRIRQVSTNQIVGSLARSLFSSLSLDVNVIGLGIGLPGTLTGLLGQADLRVHGARSGRGVLVQ